MIKKIVIYKFFILFLALAVVFLPTVLGGDSNSKYEAIITAVGIDKTGGEYEVSLQYLIPTTGGQSKERLDIISETGPDISTIAGKLNLKLGKFIGLTHCKAIIVSGAVAEEDLTRVYDYAVRFRINTNNITLIYTPDSSKDFLTAASDLQNNVYYSMSAQGNFALSYMQGSKSFLSEFYKNYMSPWRTSTLPLIEIVEEGAGESSDTGSAGGSGGGGGGGGASGKQGLSNSGKTVVIKNGKKLLELDERKSFCMNWFEPQSTMGIFSVKNVDGGQYNNATVGIEIVNKRTKIKAGFKNGVPVYHLNLDLSVRVADVEQDGLTQQNYDLLKENVNSTLKKAVIAQVKSDAEEFITYSKANNFDAINAYKTFYRYKNREFKKFLSSLSSPDNYIDNMEFEISITVRGGV